MAVLCVFMVDAFAMSCVNYEYEALEATDEKNPMSFSIHINWSEIEHNCTAGYSPQSSKHYDL